MVFCHFIMLIYERLLGSFIDFFFSECEFWLKVYTYIFVPKDKYKKELRQVKSAE